MADTTTTTASAANATQGEINSTQQSLAESNTAQSLPIERSDLEKGKLASLITHDDEDGANTTPKDPNLVTWDGLDDPGFPKNWPDDLKWKTTWAVSMFVFISPVSSAMIAPAIQDLAVGLDMHSQVETYVSHAIFILAYAVGPILFGPASELYGRKRLLQISNVWYLAWNMGCGFSHTKGQFFAFRFLAGLGGSAPLALGGGAIRCVNIQYMQRIIRDPNY